MLYIYSCTATRVTEFTASPTTALWHLKILNICTMPSLCLSTPVLRQKRWLCIVLFYGINEVFSVLQLLSLQLVTFLIFYFLLVFFSSASIAASNKSQTICTGFNRTRTGHQTSEISFYVTVFTHAYNFEAVKISWGRALFSVKRFVQNHRDSFTHSWTSLSEERSS